MHYQQKLKIQDGVLARSWDLSYIAASWHQTGLDDLQKNGFNRQHQFNEQFLIYRDKRHGLCESYYQDGKLQSSSYYENGLLNGPVTYFSHDSVVLAKSTYIQGKKCGPFFLWYPCSSIYSEQHYADGLRQGPASYYFENGQIKTQMSYIDGKIDGVQQQFYETGKPRRYSEFRAGVRQGKDLIWSAKGHPVLEANFDNGQPTGELKSYHEGGVLAEHYTYLGPAWRFHVSRFDRQGQLWQQGICHDDNRFEQKTYNLQAELIEHQIYYKDSKGQTISTELLYKEP